MQIHCLHIRKFEEIKMTKIQDTKVATEAKFPIYKDVFAAPIQHDSEGETAQPEGKILDWSKGDCEPIPGRTMPAVGLIERDYTKIYDKWIALGPNIEKGMAMKGMSWQSKQDYEEIRSRNGVIEDKNLISCGMPSIYEAKQACDAVMGLSTTTNGSVAVRAWKDLEKKTGLSNLTDLGQATENLRDLLLIWLQFSRVKQLLRRLSRVTIKIDVIRRSTSALINLYLSELLQVVKIFMLFMK